MGGLRLVLALSVVLWHASAGGQHVFIAGDVAVQTFYLVSGFFISMILNEKYVGRDALTLFYGNRFLRIFSTYFAVLILAVAAHLAIRPGLQEANLLWHPSLWPNFSASTILFLVFANLAIFGQDLCLLLKLDPSGALQFTPDFTTSDPPLFLFLVIAPAWSLAIELAFYVVAPFIVRRSVGLVLLVIGLSVGLRAIAAHYGFRAAPWSYQFFPFELASFLLGTLSYRAWTAMRRYQIGARWPYAGSIAFAVAVLLLASVPGDTGYFSPWKIACYLGVSALLPVIHDSKRLDRLDRTLGDLSYPIYLCHLTVIYVLDRLIELHAPAIPQSLRLVGILGLTVGVSTLLAQLIDVPLDRYRQWRVTRSRARGDALGADHPAEPLGAVPHFTVGREA